MGVLATLSRARCCQTANSGGRTALFFDPDLDEPPDIGWNLHAREQPRKRLRWKFCELSPQRAVQDRLEDRTQEFRRTVHVHHTLTTIPGPDADVSRHAWSVSRTWSGACQAASRYGLVKSASSWCVSPVRRSTENR